MNRIKELTVSNQNLIRIFLITAYLGMHSPIFLRFFLKNFDHGKDFEIFPLITMFGTLFILILEYTEFFLWKYEPPKKVHYLLFALRITPFAVLFIIKSTDLYAYIFGPLIIFYAMFLFKKGTREVIFAAIIIISFIIPYYAIKPSHFREKPSDILKLVMDIMRFFKVGFFYIMGFLIVEERKSIIKNMQLVNELRDSNVKIREYASRVADTVAAEERNRLARDIHDSIGHYLTATNIQLAKARAFFSINPEEALQAIENAQKTAKEAMDDVRDSVKSLKDMESFNLTDILKDTIARIEGNGVKINYMITGDDSECSYAVKLALFRVIQEALTNAVKYSGCSIINISILFEDRKSTAVIKDNGNGFDIESVPETSSGLAGIRQRIELVRGEVDIYSEIGKGTVITAKAPFDPVSTE